VVAGVEHDAGEENDDDIHGAVVVAAADVVVAEDVAVAAVDTETNEEDLHQHHMMENVVPEGDGEEALFAPIVVVDVASAELGDSRLVPQG
jgi:hypothetical protein